MIRYLLLLLGAAANPLSAQSQQAPEIGAWKVDRDLAVVSAAGIGIPVQADTLSLAKTGEASRNGEGVDDVAQYMSSDKAVFATVYVFYSTYADTALASYGTDMAIRERFGPAVMLSNESLVTVAGVPNAAIRRLYEKGMLEPGHPMTSMAGFVRAGSWMVAVRVSGPADRHGEVERAFDALLAGIRFDGADKPMAAAPLKIGAPCPALAEKPAKYLGDKASGTNALFASLMGGSIILKEEGKTTPPPLAFPKNGASSMCVRGTIRHGEGSLAILQPASTDDGTIALVVLNDAGKMLAVEPALFGKGYVVKRYDIGRIEVLGSFDRIPDADQLGAIVHGEDPRGGAVRSGTVFTPDGNSTIQVNTDMLK